MVRIGLFCCLGLSLTACASAGPMSYSLEEGEIFVAPRPQFLTVAVAGLEDRRSPEELAWAARIKLPPDLAETMNERIVRHLRVSSVFNQIQAVSGPLDPTSSDRLHELMTEGFDAVLAGDLIHFQGRSESEGLIEGQVRFGNLRLYSTHTGRLLWQGNADKRIQRQEKEPGRDDFYAVEALRGAINQLAIQLSGLTFSPGEVYPTELPAMREWRVAVLIPQDLRPPEERDNHQRKLMGNLNYSLYSDDNQALNGPITDAVARQWVKKLKAADLFGNVLTVAARGSSSEELRHWAEKGVDAVLTSQLTHSSASIIPPYDEETFTIWSGGMGFRRVFKATALTRLQDVRLIETRSGKLLWNGEAEFGIDRTIHQWEPPMNILQESVNGTLDRLVVQLSRFSPSIDEKTPVSGMRLKTYSAEVR